MGEGDTHEERFWNRVALTANPDKCWLWQGKSTIGGYGTVTVNKQTMLAHRYAWYLIYGEKPQKHLLHSCDTPLCVNPSHLREGTDKENVFDMMVRQRSAGYCLTKDDVIMVKQELQAGKTPFRIHKETGIHYHSLRRIKNGTHWSLQLLAEGGQDISPQI